MDEAELHEVGGERGGAVAARDGARELAVHLVVHAQQDRHLRNNTRVTQRLRHHVLLGSVTINVLYELIDVR